MTLRAEKHPNWKGGRYIDSSGYVQIRLAPYKYEREHRVVMQQMLGRPLKDGEIVHHRNGDKTDNRQSNLELKTSSEHTRQHWEEGGQGAFGQTARPPALCHPDRPHYAHTQCVQCYMNEAQKRYTAKNPELVQKSKRLSRLKNREATNAKRRRDRALAKQT